MLAAFKAFWDKYKTIGQPWMGLRAMTKEFQAFIKLGKEKAINLYMSMVSDTISIEYKQTTDIFHTSNNIFCVFNDLNMNPLTQEHASAFYSSFQKTIKTNPLFTSDP